MSVSEARAVGFYGVGRQLARDASVIKRAVRGVGTTDTFILGPRVAELEAALAAEVGARHAVATSSGTAALRLALQALGVGRGDEVVVGAYGFHSTISAILHLGARPVLVDVQPGNLALDPGTVAAAVTARTVGIVPVHQFAAMNDMTALRRVADRAGLWLLENSAVAIGSSRDDRRAGRWGDVGLYSLHPVKPLGGVSDGAVLVTDDDGHAARLRRLRNHGQDGIHRFLHHEVGYNARMDEVSGAVLAHRLGMLPQALARRAAVAARYTAALHARDADDVLPPSPGWEDRRGWYAYPVEADERDALARHLTAARIDTKIYYPRPLHLQEAFAALRVPRGSLPVAEATSRRSLALPLYAELTDDEVEHVAAALTGFTDA